jgi:hypothetical protein
VAAAGQGEFSPCEANAPAADRERSLATDRKRLAEMPPGFA